MEDDNNTIDRRKFLASIGLSGATLVAGCSGNTDQSNTQTTATTTATTGSPTETQSQSKNAALYGGHLRTSVSRKPNTLNPIKHVNGAEYQVTGWLYSNLTRIDHNLKVHPDLATDWEANSDATQWTFNLRDNATFHHNGRQVVARDVKKTIETVQNPDVSSPGKGTIGPIESVEAVDDTTVRLNLSSPYADIPKKMAKQFVRILPADAIENNFDKIANSDYGSGPFVLQEYKVGSQLTATAYDDYYMQDENGNSLPFVNKVTQKIFPEATAEISAMGNKNVDLMWEAPPSQWSRVKSMGSVNSNRTSGGSFANVVMRSDKPPFNDNRVRKAFKFAVDKQAMLEGAQDGLGTIGQDTPISPAYEFYKDLPQRKRNLDKAKSLLQEAGYGDGMELTLYAANSPEVRVNTAVLLKEQLKPLGVTINIKQVSYDNYLSNVWKKAPFYVGYYGMRFTEDGILYLLLHSEGSWNEAHWSDKEFDKVIEQARQATNKQKRAKLYAKAQRILQDRGPFLIPFFQDELAASRKYVDDYQIHPTGFFVPIQDVKLTSNAPTKG